MTDRELLEAAARAVIAGAGFALIKFGGGLWSDVAGVFLIYSAHTIVAIASGEKDE